MHNLYKETLAEEGIVESRRESVANAIATLHHALCYMDNEQLAVFLKKPIEHRLDDYAKAEELRVLNLGQNALRSRNVEKV